ncbi:MAG: 16S rRNA (cytidine(1402)-2'-O)-methyltransferase [Acidobacteria bacterium]|nr:16S rRNA (cytidine(1402)-2'-O)-methyltransferase [Acidobacteriota bacterium]
MKGTLYIVATPIGHLGDITFRGVETLKSVGKIAAEDTRHTRQLLEHYGVSTPVVSCHEHNEQGRSTELAALLEAGTSIALVTDAGTPLISDPGFRLVRAAVEAGIPVVPVPGPNAAIAALSASGLPAEEFVFAGFLPAKHGQRLRALEAIVAEHRTVVYYEAPHRILDALADVEAVLGPGRPVVAARELTKVHEEFLRGPVADVRATLSGRGSVKGEFTLLIGPGQPGDAPRDSGTIANEVEALIAAGAPRMEAIKTVARRHGLPKREVYQMAGAVHNEA